MTGKRTFRFIVEKKECGSRLDVVVAARIPRFSRTQAGRMISKGVIQVQHVEKKPGYRVKDGDTVTGQMVEPVSISFEPEPIDIHIIYEDISLLVINKQPGLVVHPAPGNPSGTLANALLYRWPELVGVGGMQRPGIVHRLDKDTSGVIVVAKNEPVHRHLSKQFQLRQVTKQYLALVAGNVIDEGGEVRLPIGRHLVDRKKMSTVTRKGRIARTVWRVKERFAGVTLLEVDLKTGRTHQIRVHCSAMGHPVLGDLVYGFKKDGSRRFSGNTFQKATHVVPRQMLHAHRLEFTHPITSKRVFFEARIPSDMDHLIKVLREKRVH
jgi:23S rRNA pseudouridine1911/1915/1917 synthase